MSGTRPLPRRDLEVGNDELTKRQHRATLTASNIPAPFVDTNAPGNTTRLYRLQP